MEYIYRAKIKEVKDFEETSANCIVVNSFSSSIKMIDKIFFSYGLILTIKNLIKILSKKRILVTVLHEDKIVSFCWLNLGFCKYYPIEPNSVVIGPVWTDENYRKQGFATSLLKAALVFMKNDTDTDFVYIDTSEQNLSMQSVIKKCGFGEPISSFEL